MEIIISAVSGSGKTTILNYLKEKLPKARIVNEGDLIFEIAKKKLGIKNRDELREKLTIEQQRKIQELVAKKISKMKDKIILIDTHLSIKTPSGYFPGLSEKVVSTIKPEAIVILEFDPKDVIERRSKDPKRKRDKETEKQIEEQQKMNRDFAFAAATEEEGATVEIINLRYRQKKPFEHTVKAANEIIKIIKRNTK
jgi:adenylate kinase